MKENKDTEITALLSGPDRPGLVAGVASWIYERGGNILHADQHHDASAGVFFQRVVWQPGGDAAKEAEDFGHYAHSALGMTVRTALAGALPKVMIMVSRTDHCFHDIVLRFRSGEIGGQLVGVISNHADLAEVAGAYGLPFHHLAVPPDDKESAERAQCELIRESGAELVILARYMQILSQDFLHRVGCPVINIHHSFLPAFTGARPYHQAHARGVKLIGATAHYATADLDEGPIIAQSVAQVSHRNSPTDLMRLGRDLEKTVFARAVRYHLENRILVYNNKTVVFD